METKNIKTFENWKNSGKLFSDFVKPDDQIDEDLYNYFLEVLPPAYWKNGICQVGEISFHDGNGIAYFSTFGKDRDTFKYLGERPRMR